MLYLRLLNSAEMAVLEELKSEEKEEEFLEQVEQFKRDVADERKKYEPTAAEKIFSGRE